MSIALVETPLEPGFNSPALDAQIAFRSLMEAWARPGTIAHLPLASPPPSLNEAAASIALTLCDGDTPVWLSQKASASQNWLRFHCSCSVVEAQDQRKAAFGISTLGEMPPLGSFSVGSAVSPEEGATLLVMLPEDDASQPDLILNGPGIAGERRLAGFSLPSAVLDERASLARLYPAGLDLILVRKDKAVCLPRTTSIRVEIT